MDVVGTQPTSVSLSTSVHTGGLPTASICISLPESFSPKLENPLCVPSTLYGSSPQPLTLRRQCINIPTSSPGGMREQWINLTRVLYTTISQGSPVGLSSSHHSISLLDNTSLYWSFPLSSSSSPIPYQWFLHLPNKLPALESWTLGLVWRFETKMGKTRAPSNSLHPVFFHSH